MNHTEKDSKAAEENCDKRYPPALDTGGALIRLSYKEGFESGIAHGRAEERKELEAFGIDNIPELKRSNGRLSHFNASLEMQVAQLTKERDACKIALRKISNEIIGPSFTLRRFINHLRNIATEALAAIAEGEKK